jgi:hypothetical protein
MLYYSEEIKRRLKQIGSQALRKGQGKLEAARALLAIAPDLAPAILMVALERNAAGEHRQAEEQLWMGLRRAPCYADLYFSLSVVIQTLRPEDPVSSRLMVEGLWKLALAETIDPDTAKRMAGSVEGVGAADDPSTYRLAAESYEEELDESAETDPRLRPLRGLTRLQQEAPDEVDSETLRDVLEHAEDYEPLLYAALRQWANEREEYHRVDRDAVQVFIALLGEIGGPERIADLLELSEIAEPSTFLHVHWAIWRLGQRFPVEALKTFHEAAHGASIGKRCALAEQLNLLPEMNGVVEALAGLLTGFAKFGGQRDAAYLVAAVTTAMADRGAVEDAHALLSRCRGALGDEGCDWLDESLEGDAEFTPKLVEEQIPELDIDDVCVGRALVDIEEEEDDLGDDDEDWLEEDEEEEDDDEEEKPLGLRVLKGLERWHSAKDQKRSAMMYLGKNEYGELSPDDFDGYMQFLLHDFRDEKTGLTLIEHYLEDHRGDLTADERNTLESMRDARFGLYEMVKIEKGRGVHMRDAFDGATFFVEDITTSREQVKGSYGLVRVQFLDGRYILAGNGTMVHPDAAEELKEFVRKESRKARQGEAEFVRAHSHTLRQWVAGWHQRRMENLRVVDRAGDELEFCTARYEVLDGPVLLSKLRSLEELVEEKSKGATVRFGWMDPGEGPRPVHGGIEVTGAGLRLDTTSRRRLELGRELLEHHAGRQLKYLGDSSTSVNDLVARKKAPRASRAPSEEERRLLLAYKEQHYATWPDTALPALKGKTPRQAVRTKAGREAVSKLLRSMEFDEAQSEGADGVAFDFGKLRKALGLEDE